MKIFSKHRAIWIIVLTAVIIHIPAMLSPDAGTHSVTYNFIWTRQFADAITAGDVYPRWFDDSFEGLGSPTFYFYPPIAFWTSGGLAALGLDTLCAVAIAAMIFSATSGFAMYCWLAGRTPHAVVGAIAYMIAPYHLFDLYVRGALAEYAAFVWLPLIVWAIDRLPGKRAVAFLAGSYAGLILTHLPTALLATIFLIVPYASYRAYRERNKFLPGLAGGLLGIALASFYLVPALTLQEYISTDLLWSEYYRPSSWFPWNRSDVVYLISLPALALALIICGASAKNFWGFIACIAGASSMGFVPLVWDVELLAHVQFPWRLLAIVEFAAITAIALGPYARRLLRLGIAVAVLPIMILFLMALSTIRSPADLALIRETRPDAPEYLPRGLETDVTETQRRPDLTAFRKLPRSRTLYVQQPGRVTIGHADFPVWQVVNEGKIIQHTGPLINFYAPKPGLYVVERKVIITEIVGWMVSILTGIVLLILCLINPQRGMSPSPKSRESQPAVDELPYDGDL